MSYFQFLPKIEYTSSIDGRKKLITNILASVRRKDSAIVNDYMLFDAYVIKDGETPEIVADKFYGHTRWWWVVLISSGKVMKEDWPMSEVELDLVIDRMTAGDRNIEWGFVDEKGDPVSRYVRKTFTANGEVIDWHESGEGLGAERNGVIRARGRYLTVEEKLRLDNEKKRNCSLINPNHLSDFVNEFQSLMSSRRADGEVDF